jgi:hypothetical protein
MALCDLSSGELSLLSTLFRPKKYFMKKNRRAKPFFFWPHSHGPEKGDEEKRAESAESYPELKSKQAPAYAPVTSEKFFFFASADESPPET